jgi:hypothetical protein
MVKSLRCRTRRFGRPPRRPCVRRILRRPYHSCLRHFAGYRRGPDALSQALTAFTRAIRAHRRLAKLAPELFDATEINRLTQRCKEDAAWRAVWEPALNRIYGSEPIKPAPGPFAHIPPLPKSPRTRRAVERELASWRLWMTAGSLAFARYQRRRPYALLSLTRIARLFEIGFAFAELACGQPAQPDTAGHERALADLERIYGDRKAADHDGIPARAAPRHDALRDQWRG